MASTLYVMEAANIFCGDADPSLSHHLDIRNVKLPELVENFVDHAPGGAPWAIEIDTHINRLEATFDLAGWDANVMSILASWSLPNRNFTVWGVIRDRQSGTPLEGQAIIQGRLGRVNPQPWRRGELQHHEYSIRSITGYQLTLNQVQIYNWNFFTNQLVIGGVDMNADTNTILKIPAAVSA
jgi:uncharacterized protein